MLRRAFWDATQSGIARKAARRLGVSERMVVYWLKCENDMPSWAVKACLAALDERYMARWLDSGAGPGWPARAVGRYIAVLDQAVSFIGGGAQ